MRPIVDLDFGGDELNEAFLPKLEGFKFTDRDNAADRLELTFRNDKQDLTEYYPPGMKVAFRYGYLGRLSQWRTMTVRKIKMSGEDSLVVEGKSNEFDMDTEQKTRTFEGLSYIGIAQQIAGEYGYPPEAIFLPEDDDLPYLEMVCQAAETDAQFLRRLADEHANYVFWMNEAEFHFHEPDHSKRPLRVLDYRAGSLVGNITKLGADLNLVQNPVKVTKKGYDQKGKKPLESEAGSSDEGAVLGKYELGGGELGKFSGYYVDKKTGLGVPQYELGGDVVVWEGGLPVTVGTVPPAQEFQALIPSTTDDEEGLGDEAKSTLKKRKNSRLKFSVTCEPGDPYLRAKEVVELRGAAIFSGPVYVKEAVHVIKAGTYTQELQLIKGYLGRKPKKKQDDSTEAGGDVNDTKAGDGSPGGVQLDKKTGMKVPDPQAPQEVPFWWDQSPVG